MNKAARTDMGQQSDRVVRIIAERERERERELWVEWFRISATPINRPSLTGANKAPRTDKGQQLSLIHI